MKTLSQRVGEKTGNMMKATETMEYMLYNRTWERSVNGTVNFFNTPTDREENYNCSITMNGTKYNFFFITNIAKLVRTLDRMGYHGEVKMTQVISFDNKECDTFTFTI